MKHTTTKAVKPTPFQFTYKPDNRVSKISGRYVEDHVNQAGAHVVVFKRPGANYTTQVLWRTLTPESIAEIERIKAVTK